ncbi:MAG: N-acetyl-gamma-glutamyl-phosphate reductase [Planctomycetaceae bacterium]|jgi:N-acetyl-gamma-glutamyl-phosphate reductase|nr:N-acetyl-gamma-glutamyl-phosphate reductase [Planctomycetaceae bacterium]
MTKVAILGATGYTALELIKLLLRHPGTEITALTSREETAPVNRVHPSLTGRISLPMENLSVKEIASRAECVFSCLPHTASATVIPELLENGVKVVDFSADYRLDSPEVFKKWYEAEHPDANRLGKVPYGLPELFRKSIIPAKLVANPGCYPTTAILPLTPLLREKLIEPSDIILDSKSGVSGGGRKPKLNYHYPECNESITTYKIGKHRHLPEINQYLSLAAGKPLEVIFTPHLTPMDRGILTTAYAKPTRTLTQSEILEVLQNFYENEPFVQVVEHLPGTKEVAFTNKCHVTARIVGERVMTISVIDNLIKGASGSAVQNFNLMFGYEETLALL